MTAYVSHWDSHSFSDVSDNSLPDAGASAAMASAPSSFPATVPHHTRTQCYSLHYVATPAHLYCTIPPRTRLPCATRSQNTAYVPPRSSDVSDTSLPNAGASAAMLFAPNPFPATTPHHTRTHRYSQHYVATPAYLHCTIPTRTRLPCATR